MAFQRRRRLNWAVTPTAFTLEDHSSIAIAAADVLGWNRWSSQQAFSALLRGVYASGPRASVLDRRRPVPLAYVRHMPRTLEVG
jgi:hypothetical protein